MKERNKTCLICLPFFTSIVKTLFCTKRRNTAFRTDLRSICEKFLWIDVSSFYIKTLYTNAHMHPHIDRISLNSLTVQGKFFHCLVFRQYPPTSASSCICPFSLQDRSTVSIGFRAEGDSSCMLMKNKQAFSEHSQY